MWCVGVWLLFVVCVCVSVCVCGCVCVCVCLFEESFSVSLPLCLPLSLSPSLFLSLPLSPPCFSSGLCRLPTHGCACPSYPCLNELQRARWRNAVCIIRTTLRHK